MARRKSPFLKLGFLLAALIVLGYFFRAWWLPFFGRALVHDDGPAKADIAVVLAGDYSGHRIETAARLVRDGYVPAVLVSGPPGAYGNNEADLALRFIAREGYPANWFIALPNTALSTKEEAAVILSDLRRRNVHSFLLVTSNYHTARAGRIYRASERALGYRPAIREIAAPDDFFNPEYWWRSRESKKIAFNEWIKTISSALGI